MARFSSGISSILSVGVRPSHWTMERRTMNKAEQELLELMRGEDAKEKSGGRGGQS